MKKPKNITLIIPTLKPKNPHLKLVSLMKAGFHQKTDKSLRKLQKQNIFKKLNQEY